jgi:hypothetical protein
MAANLAVLDQQNDEEIRRNGRECFQSAYLMNLPIWFSLSF